MALDSDCGSDAMDGEPTNIAADPEAATVRIKSRLFIMLFLHLRPGAGQTTYFKLE